MAGDRPYNILPNYLRVGVAGGALMRAVKGKVWWRKGMRFAYIVRFTLFFCYFGVQCFENHEFTINNDVLVLLTLSRRLLENSLWSVVLAFI